MKYPIHFAPLQGYTEDAYRRIHHALFGGVAQYYTPFVRLEHGTVRTKDLRDLRPEHNEGVPIIPQVIANGGDEMERVVAVVKDMGYRRIDINAGCPFPLQTRHGRGAALAASPERMEQVASVVRRHADVTFSLKMRLGMESADEWQQVMPVVNAMPLVHVAVHPRVAKQQYKGELHLSQFEALLSVSTHPVIYNGEVHGLSDLQSLEKTYGDRLAGVMVGRGLLAQPWLAAEYAAGAEWPAAERLRLLRALHAELLAHYERLIPGEAQRLQKLRTLWDYLEPTLGRKQWKRLLKAGNMKNYLAAVADIRLSSAPLADL